LATVCLLGHEHADHRHGNCHQRRLGILGEREVRLGAFPHELRKLLPQGGIDLVEHGAGHGEILRQRLAHADRLTALARKHEGRSHSTPQSDSAFATKMTRIQLTADGGSAYCRSTHQMNSKQHSASSMRRYFHPRSLAAPEGAVGADVG
jgi:hypothetical protein